MSKCEVWIQLIGDETTVRKARRKMQGRPFIDSSGKTTRSPIDFNRIIPMPVELNCRVNGKVIPVALSTYRSEYNGSAFSIDHAPISKRQATKAIAGFSPRELTAYHRCLYNLIVTDFATSKDWRLLNWGCTSNARQVKDWGDGVTMSFVTDDSPFSIFRELSRMYPTLTIIFSHKRKHEDCLWNVEFVNGQIGRTVAHHLDENGAGFSFVEGAGITQKTVSNASWNLTHDMAGGVQYESAMNTKRGACEVSVTMPNSNTFTVAVVDSRKHHWDMYDVAIPNRYFGNEVSKLIQTIERSAYVGFLVDAIHGTSSSVAIP